MNPPTSDIKILSKETTHFLQELVRIKTVNPPGEEIKAAEYIKKVLATEQIKAEILESKPGRGNIIARLNGNGEKKPLLLMAHLDTVQANEDNWIFDPFGGTIADGKLYGRGSYDCKFSAALWMGVMLYCKRLGLPLKRDIILCATADEEISGESGMKWIVDNHFEKIQCEAALNEGGGFGFQLGGKAFYNYQVAEKGSCWIKLVARGTEGHSSIPTSDNAILKIADAIKNLSSLRFPINLRPSIAEFLDVFIDNLLNARLASITKQMISVGDIIPANLMDHIAALFVGEEKGPALMAMVHNTLTPTVIKGGGSYNAIPGKASTIFDLRYLPEQNIYDLLDKVKKQLGDDIVMEIVNNDFATESPIDNPLTVAIKKSIQKNLPGVPIVPFLLPGTSDGRYLRAKNIPVYGFSPLHPDDDPEVAHKANEFVSIKSIEFGLKTILDLIFFYCL